MKKSMTGQEIYHFIGLGGIGMSALARILLQKGVCVQGSDKTMTPLLQELEKEGAKVRIGHSEEGVEGIVVYSSAIPPSHQELQAAKKQNLALLHRADLLSFLMQGKKPLLVTGSHGKTTTTSLLAHVFLQAKKDPSFAIGGILQSEKTNGRLGKGEFFIAEADESDGSFLKAEPFGAIVTNLDAEHLDFWKTQAHLREALSRFFAKVKTPQHLFWCADDPHLVELGPPGISYGFSPRAELRISSFKETEEGIQFDVAFQGKVYPEISLPLMGRHNALNSAAVFGLGLSLGMKELILRKALATFGGVERRLERKQEIHRVVLYDDYGHHPTEIRATLSALRQRIRERRLLVVFQPHRYSRVRDHQEAFAKAFSEADQVFLTDIYSAGEASIEGVSTEALFAAMQKELGKKVHWIARSHLKTFVAQELSPFDVLLTLGAGDITTVGPQILDTYAERKPTLRIGVLCGGLSPEHDVSRMSAKNIASALDPKIYEVQPLGIAKDGGWSLQVRWEDKTLFAAPPFNAQTLGKLEECDVCIPVLHGPAGEDGMIQGFLDTLAIPYVGCDYRSSALCMQKAWTKQAALAHGVPTAFYFEVHAAEFRRSPDFVLQRDIAFPVWVKAVHLGSSIGVARAANREEFFAAIENAFAYDDTLIVEQEIVGRQIEFAVIGNEWIRVAAPCEILNRGLFYDFERKYGPDAVGVEIPARLSPLELQVGVSLAETVYRACGCQGLARVDFFLDQEGHFWLNEVNPMPGFTHTSGFPKMWEQVGWSQAKLLDELIILALQRGRKKEVFCR